MEKEKKIINNRWSVRKIVLIVIIAFIVFVIIEQVSVYNTLKGDGKIHHVIVKPDTPTK